MGKEPIATKKFNPFANIWIVIIITILGLELFSYLTFQGESKTLSYNQFKNRMEQNSIKEVWIDKDQVVASVKVEMSSKPTYLKTTLPPFEDKSFLALLEKNQVDIHVKSQKESNFWLMFILLLPLFFFLGFMLYGTNRIKKQLGV
jgi:ATP-dependent Zn protease